ncbi:SLOG family protein [Kineosporia babensis]|uniref:DUF2493 domain-containing protein n=1 Tax=Kineosporia babensis TaxID=499548 RepID=A0A9X1ND90_9ACTN|nr:SLOG family protein [Kineosporia babensis]MCD5310908.1 DUF2493 domain-containing protein [Kineosporia babensis]
MRILVTGSRYWSDEDAVHRALVTYSRRGDVIVHGACPTGADAIADWWAIGNGRDVERHPALWRVHGKAAGPMRNRQMVELGADLVLAFPLGPSTGTRGCMAVAEAAGLRVLNLGDAS